MTAGAVVLAVAAVLAVVTTLAVIREVRRMDERDQRHGWFDDEGGGP